jgi:hypothetical protein
MATSASAKRLTELVDAAIVNVARNQTEGLVATVDRELSNVEGINAIRGCPPSQTVVGTKSHRNSSDELLVDSNWRHH